MERNIRKSNREIERIIFKLVNKERSERGLRELSPKAYLVRAARRHSRDMIRRHFYGHENKSGVGPLDRVEQSVKENKSFFGMLRRFFTNETSSYVGENICRMPVGKITGFSYINSEWYVAKAIIISWMRSPGHRRNILDPNFRRIGIGVACKRKGKNREYYATQDFQD